MRRTLCWTALLAVLGATAAIAAPPTVKPTFDLRLRSEGWDAPARNTTAESSYEFSLVRARLGVDVAWEHWTLHGMLQGNGAVGLPENGSFGAGAYPANPLPAFGQVTAVNDPRSLQLALRVRF